MNPAAGFAIARATSGKESAHDGRFRAIAVDRATQQLHELGFDSGRSGAQLSGYQDSEIVGDRAVARIRVVEAPVDHQEIKNLDRNPAARSKHKFFFSHEGFTWEAIGYADAAQIALFRISPSGAVVPANRYADAVVAAAKRWGPWVTFTRPGRFLVPLSRCASITMIAIGMLCLLTAIEVFTADVAPAMNVVVGVFGVLGVAGVLAGWFSLIGSIGRTR